MPLALYQHVGNEQIRVGAEASTRTGLIAELAGLAVLVGVSYTARTYRVIEQGNITDRYTKAIEQPGSTRLDVRLSGIYALERIAVDSTRDHPTVVEVLGACVRQHTDPTQHRRRPPPVAGQDKAPPRPAVDVQAAVSVVVSMLG